MDQQIGRKEGFSTIDVAIFLMLIAIIGVVVFPRYSRFAKTAEAKTYIHKITEASKATLEEYQEKNSKTNLKEIPPDEELIAALTRHMGGAIPENPFTKRNTITIQHHSALAPCNSLDAEGGWLWNLVPRGDQKSTLTSKVWLNSDTVNISNGRGESCIQP